MKTFSLLLLAALSAQFPARDTAVIQQDGPHPCTEQRGGPYPTVEDGRFSPLTSQWPTI